ncbi:hypothetical protein I4U23_000668 [Adineta vaga]|nr:hypothetical protein I4U23_000668 [Adineta vaga]
MVHYGRHIIVPGTDLCEICDRGILYERKKGKRQGKKFLYTNQDGKFTYRPSNVVRRLPEETIPRQRRKSYHAEPLTARSRPVVRQEPIVVQKRVVQRAYTPPDTIQLSSRAPLPPPQGATLYYVDDPNIQSARSFQVATPRQRRQSFHAEPSTARSRPVVQRSYTPPNTIPLSSRAPPAATLYYVDDPVIENKPRYVEPLTTRSRPAVREEPPKQVVRRAYTPPDAVQLASRMPTGATLYYVDDPIIENKRRSTHVEPLTARSRPVIQEEPPKQVLRRAYTPPGPTLYYMDDSMIENKRKTVEPLTTRSRPIVQEESPKQVVRRSYTPPGVPLSSRAPPPGATLYYVDEPRQQFTGQPQKASSPPRRQTNSDSETPGRPYVIDSYDPSRKANLYYLDQPQKTNGYTSLSSPPSQPKVIYQEESPRKQRQLEPVTKNPHDDPELTVVRRVYKKLPAGSSAPPEEDYIPNGNRPVRKIEKFYPTPKQYNSSLQSTQRQLNSPFPNTNPSIYYIQST